MRSLRRLHNGAGANQNTLCRHLRRQLAHLLHVLGIGRGAGRGTLRGRVEGDELHDRSPYFFASSASSFSKLCVQPASMPPSIAATRSPLPLSLVWKVIFVLPLPASSKVTVVRPSRMILSFSSTALLVKTMRSFLFTSLNTPRIGASRKPMALAISSLARITIWISPPARASHSLTGLVKPCGPNHWASIFPSVQDLKTRSRGASNTRVMVSSRLCICSLIVFSFHYPLVLSPSTFAKPPSTAFRSGRRRYRICARRASLPSSR